MHSFIHSFQTDYTLSQLELRSTAKTYLYVSCCVLKPSTSYRVGTTFIYYLNTACNKSFRFVRPIRNGKSERPSRFRSGLFVRLLCDGQYLCASVCVCKFQGLFAPLSSLSMILPRISGWTTGLKAEKMGLPYKKKMSTFARTFHNAYIAMYIKLPKSVACSCDIFTIVKFLIASGYLF